MRPGDSVSLDSTYTTPFCAWCVKQVLNKTLLVVLFLQSVLVLTVAGLVCIQKNSVLGLYYQIRKNKTLALIISFKSTLHDAYIDENLNHGACLYHSFFFPETVLFQMLQTGNSNGNRRGLREIYQVLCTAVNNVAKKRGRY